MWLGVWRDQSRSCLWQHMQHKMWLLPCFWWTLSEGVSLEFQAAKAQASKQFRSIPSMPASPFVPDTSCKYPSSRVGHQRTLFMCLMSAGENLLSLPRTDFRYSCTFCVSGWGLSMKLWFASAEIKAFGYNVVAFCGESVFWSVFSLFPSLCFLWTRPNNCLGRVKDPVQCLCTLLQVQVATHKWLSNR